MKLLSGRRLNNFLQADRCMGLLKCFENFHFSWNIWRFNYFSASLGEIVAKFFLMSYFLSKCNNMKVEQHINHGAIQKVYHLHNVIFHSINLRLTFLMILYTSLVFFTKTLKIKTMKWEKRRIFQYIAASAYYFISKEVSLYTTGKPW